MTDKRATVLETVRELKEQGLSHNAIAIKLDKLGIRTAKNTKPSSSYVNNIITILKKQSRSGGATRPPVHPIAAKLGIAPNTPRNYVPRPWLRYLLEDVNLTPQMKIEAIKILLGEDLRSES